MIVDSGTRKLGFKRVFIQNLDGWEPKNIEVIGVSSVKAIYKAFGKKIRKENFVNNLKNFGSTEEVITASIFIARRRDL